MDRVQRAKMIGTALARARTRAGMSQPEFARELGKRLDREPFNPSRVSRWENGDTGDRPDAEVLIAAAEIAKEPVGALLEFDYWERLAGRIETVIQRLDTAERRI